MNAPATSLARFWLALEVERERHGDTYTPHHAAIREEADAGHFDTHPLADDLLAKAVRWHERRGTRFHGAATFVTEMN